MESITFWRCARCGEAHTSPREASNPDAGVGALICWRCYNNAKVGAPIDLNRAERRQWVRKERQAAIEKRPKPSPASTPFRPMPRQQRGR